MIEALNEEFRVKLVDQGCVDPLVLSIIENSGKRDIKV